MKLSEVNIGDVFKTNQGGSYTITATPNYNSISIRHNDDYGHEMVVRLQRIETGEIKNPYFPSVCGVGFVGTGLYGYQDKEAIKLWKGCLTRATSLKTKSRQPCYEDVTISPEWYNFQNFAKWFYEQKYYQKGFQLDKDILLKGNKEYSPNTCCLVPQEINKLFIRRDKKDRDLPVGVSFQRGGYSVKAGQKYIGRYKTPQEASDVYNSARREYILTVLSSWKDMLSDDVIEAVIRLSDKRL